MQRLPTRFCSRLLLFVLSGLVAGGVRADNEIQLHSRTFLPSPGITAQDRAEILASPNARVHVILQTEYQPDDTELAELAALGVYRGFYIPQRAWIGSIPNDSSTIDQILNHPAVRSIVAIQPDDRLSQDIRGDGIDARLFDGIDGRAYLELRIHDDVSMDEAVAELGQVVGEFVDLNDFLHVMLVKIDPSQLGALSQADSVALIHEVALPGEDDNDNVRINTNASNVQIVEDVVVAGAVTGIQPGTPYALDGLDVQLAQWESGRPDTCHPDFQGTLQADGTITGANFRVTYGTDADGISDTDCRTGGYVPTLATLVADHPTHVAGIVLGNGSQSLGAGGITDQWRGVAPNAEIVAFAAARLDPAPPDGISDATPVGALAAQLTSALPGIELGTTSWGSSHCHWAGVGPAGAGAPTASCYDLGSELYDKLILDPANPTRSNAIAIFGSSGNRGPGSFRQPIAWGGTRMPTSAKNTIVVGAVFADTNGLTNYSSRGPVDDGRVKPDVIGPGELAAPGRINSTVMTIFSDFGGPLCVSDPAINPNGVDDCQFPYDGIGGTSMSTPAVAGVGALVVQQYRTRGSDPWPSTIKGVLIHSAVDQCCVDTDPTAAPDNPGPDYAFGYGLVDVQAAVDLIRDDRHTRIVEAPGFSGAGSCSTVPTDLCDYDGDSGSDDDTYVVDLPPGLPGYRVTLVWDDLPTAPALLAIGAPALRNDLDLFLVSPSGTVFRPWVLNPAAPNAAAAPGIDNRNVVEVVDLPAGYEAGAWTIVVRPTQLVPNDDEQTLGQRYTLIYESFEKELLIRDITDDDGGVPTVRYEFPPGSGWTPQRFWESPAIEMDGGEFIMPGTLRTIHVEVTNPGNAPIDNATVNLYWSETGVGLDYMDFTANPIGSCPGLSVGAGSTADCELDYTWMPGSLTVGADGIAHVCLLATVESAEDPISYPGYSAVTMAGLGNPAPEYVPFDNNIAQENVEEEYTYDGDGIFDIQVHAPGLNQTTIELIADTSGLPPGWMAELPDGSFYNPLPGGFVPARVKITPASGAPVGERGSVPVWGVDLSTNQRIGGSTYALQVGTDLADADTDGIPDIADNCVFTPNPSQANLDNDARGDLCDCAPTEMGSWDFPEPITNLALSQEGYGPTDVELVWDSLAAAAGIDTVYDISTGLLNTAPLFSDAICLDSNETGAGPVVETHAPVAPDEVRWFAVRGENQCRPGSWNSGGPTQLGDRDSAILTCASCAHGRCVEGVALDSACDPCVTSICALDSYCCTTAWDNVCVEEVRTICNSLICSESQGSCVHTLCHTGSALAASCDAPPASTSCVDQICAVDPYCCGTLWDDVCISEVGSICGGNCD